MKRQAQCAWAGLLAGGLLALWQIQQAGERMRGLNEWSSNEAGVKHALAQRLTRSGAPWAQRISPGNWRLQLPWPVMGADDPSRGPWWFAHWESNTTLNCQGGSSQSTQLIDAYSFSTPDRLMCNNPLHAGNARQTLAAGIRAWVIQLAVQTRSDPPAWQWQAFNPTHTGESVWAIRLCWRTTPEHPLPQALAPQPTAASSPSPWDCELPWLGSPHRDRWQWLAHWNGRRPLP